MQFLRWSLIIIALSVGVSSAEAQIVNPATLEIPASADHNTSFAGTPIVQKYEALVVRQSATGTVLYVTDLGKPTPNASNVIVVPMPLSGTGGSAPNNTLLQVSVRVTGPGGSASSVLSDPFGAVGAPAAPGKPVPKP